MGVVDWAKKGDKEKGWAETGVPASLKVMFMCLT